MFWNMTEDVLVGSYLPGGDFPVMQGYHPRDVHLCRIFSLFYGSTEDFSKIVCEIVCAYLNYMSTNVIETDSFVCMESGNFIGNVLDWYIQHIERSKEAGRRGFIKSCYPHV